MRDAIQQANDSLPGPEADAPEDDACPRCEGAGFVRKAVRLGHPDFGRAFPCDCTQNEEEDDKRARLLRYSNLGPLSRLSFDNLSPRGRSPSPQHQERFAAAVQAGLAFAEKPAGWLVFVGPSGCGKTHMAAAIAGRSIEKGQAALFMVVPDLLDHLRGGYQPDAETGYDELFEMVRNAPVLVLDDLGVQSKTPWVEEKLFQLINHRYSAQLPTVITTNLDMASFESRVQTRLSDPALSQVHYLEGGASNRISALDSLELPLLKSMTFKSFQPEKAAADARELSDLQKIQREAVKFASELNGWFVLVGEAGKGKTRIAAGIANFSRDAGRDVLFVVVPDLLDSLRSSYDSQNSRGFDSTFDRVRNSELLVLDDLGAQSGTAWADEKLFQLINYRYNARLPTIFTTNSRKAELGSRLIARLTDPQISTVFEIGGFNILGSSQAALTNKPRGRPRSN